MIVKPRHLENNTYIVVHKSLQYRYHIVYRHYSIFSLNILTLSGQRPKTRNSNKTNYVHWLLLRIASINPLTSQLVQLDLSLKAS